MTHNGRIERERKTIRALIGLYCRDNHGGTALCAECQELENYALARLDRCPFGKEKPTCANCPIHCYKPDMKERVRKVMRYAGPRILFHHPILALLHMLDGFRKAPPRS